MTDISLEKIFSGVGDSAPASEPAPRVDEPEQIVSEPVNTIGTEQVDGQPHKDEVTDDKSPADGQKTVPLAALQEERGKAKRYTEQIADFDKRLKESDERWEKRLTELLGRMNLPSQPQQQPVEQQRPDFFENPDAAVQHTLAPHLQQFERVLMANAQLTAASVHGQDKVHEAERAFMEAMQAKTLDPADYHRVVNSPNRWDAAVQWHKRQSALAEIGEDPAAYRERIKAELLAEIQQTGRLPTGQPSAAAPPAVTPSNLADARNAGHRTGPDWAGPPPLREIFK